MDELPPFTKQPAFINRTKELRDLRSWISAQPENILFLYGPKSSGKTTLLYRFIEQNLDGRHFDIKHFNLREMLLVNYESFLKAFFELKPTEQVKETRQYDLKVFKLSVETIKGLENRELDPFVVMKRELIKQVKKGKRPVIIIDELQALDEIYFNGQRELLKEMFNFFVAMTKESHLCHVIISSSDGYFIERIHNDSKLKKTSELMEIGYIDHDDVMEWLNNLKKYSKIELFVLTDDQKNAIWDMFGGSCWEISNFLGKLLTRAADGRIPQDRFDNLMQTSLMTQANVFEDRVGLNARQQKLWKTIATIIPTKPSFKLRDLDELVTSHTWTEPELRKELGDLVRYNFLSYAPPLAAYALQGRSMELGLQEYIKMLR